MQPRCEVDYLPPDGAEIKNIWSYTFIPPCAFIVWTGAALIFINLYTKFGSQTQLPQHPMLFTI
jgi:hypothetical protein